jgi:hypothetical protein
MHANYNWKPLRVHLGDVGLIVVGRMILKCIESVGFETVNLFERAQDSIKR